MQDIVEMLTALSGVNQVGIYNNGDIVSTNFTAEHQQAMLGSSEIVTQIFLALESVEKTHNEIFIGINSGYLAGFRLFGGHVALLLTDKKINLPMLSMGIKSASERLKQQIEEAKQAQVRQSNSVSSSVLAPEVAPTDESLIPVFQQYVYILTAFLGPAAKVVVDDAVVQWKSTYDQSTNNLTYLVSMLENELETNNEKQLFKSEVARVITPDM